MTLVIFYDLGASVDYLLKSDNGLCFECDFKYLEISALKTPAAPAKDEQRNPLENVHLT